MKQKPSERIQELYKKKKEAIQPKDNADILLTMLDATWEYLDEEHEKQQAIINSDKTGKIGMV